MSERVPLIDPSIPDYDESTEPPLSSSATTRGEHRRATDQRWLDRIRRQLSEGLPPTDHLEQP